MFLHVKTHKSRQKSIDCDKIDFIFIIFTSTGLSASWDPNLPPPTFRCVWMCKDIFSSTYPCQLGGPSVTLSDFHCVGVSGPSRSVSGPLVSHISESYDKHFSFCTPPPPLYLSRLVDSKSKGTTPIGVFPKIVRF